MTSKQKTATCFDCKHFIITWDKLAPRGCEAHGFKTERIPSAVVYEESGITCQLFEPKEDQTT